MAKLGRKAFPTASAKMPVEQRRLRFNILVDDFHSYGECVIEGLERWWPPSLTSVSKLPTTTARA